MSILHNKIDTGFESGLYTGMILIDLQKAFDTLNHKVEFSEETTKWFKSYLSNRKFKVHVKNTFSEWFPTGVENILRTWHLVGGGGLSQYEGGAWEGLKMLLKNTSEGVYMIVKLLAKSLQAFKFTKNELFHTYFSRFLARF